MQYEPSFDDGRPPYGSAFAAELVGKYVLVGITFQDMHGNVKRQEQFHGIVVTADAKDGFRLELRGAGQGGHKTLPPDTTSFHAARKGHYKLSSTGETVIDPDYLSTWTVGEPDA